MGVTSKGTDRRTIRVGEPLWSKFDEATASHEGGRSGILRDFMRWYLAEDGAELPERPSDRRTGGATESPSST